MSPKRILIIGSGISGLALSQGLKRASVPFHIFESDPTPTFRPQGYRFRVNPSGASALQELLTSELWHRFEKVCAQGPSIGGRFNAIDAEPITSPFGGGPPPGSVGKSYTADRTTTRNLLLRGLDENISFGKRLVKYEETDEGVTAYFEDGSEARGSFLVGAEGLRSVVRKQCLPKQLILDTDCRCLYGKTMITEEFLARFNPAAMKGMTVLFDGSSEKSTILLLEAIKFQDNELRSELPEDYIYWVLGGAKEDFETPDHELLHLSGPEVADLSLKIADKWDSSFKAVLELQERDMASALRISIASPEIPA